MRPQLREDIHEATRGGIPQYMLTHKERMSLVGINDSLAEDIYESIVRDHQFMRKNPNDTYSKPVDVD